MHSDRRGPADSALRNRAVVESNRTERWALHTAGPRKL